MKYIKNFNDHSNYINVIDNNYLYLNKHVVSYCKSEDHIHIDNDPYNGHDYVDLGLPSGTKWATMNVGASSVTDYGNYYRYGKGSAQYAATSAQSDYYGTENYSGTENTLATSADTAAQVWGGQWHMPTSAQCEELIASTTYEWTTIDGVNGGKFTAQNGNYIFIPAAGNYYNGSIYDVGSNGYIWSSTPDGSNYAYYLNVLSGGKNIYSMFGRGCGFSVRGVVD